MLIQHIANSDMVSLADRLKHVYWIGGGSGAGKSTIARHLAQWHNLRLYGTDDVMAQHAARSTPEDSPYLADFMTMSMDERWLNRSPETMLETFHWFRGEGFSFIVEDLLALPPEQSVLVEGFRLLPHLVAPLLDQPHQAVWLLPTPAFRKAALETRAVGWSIAGKTSDPPRALNNLLERDRMFTDRLRAEVKRFDLRAIEVDHSISEGELAAQVKEIFKL